MRLEQSEIDQLDLLKQKRPDERFLLMVQLIESQRSVMKAGLRFKNPGVDEERLNECRKDRMLKMYSLKISIRK